MRKMLKKIKKAYYKLLMYLCDWKMCRAFNKRNAAKCVRWAERTIRYSNKHLMMIYA